MLKWQDPLSESTEARIKTLADDLRRMKSKGWSVIFSDNEIIVRPKDRTVGKFSITSSRDDLLYATFFSRQLNYWNKSKYFDLNHSVAVTIKEWMELEAADPLKRVRSDFGSEK